MERCCIKNYYKEMLLSSSTNASAFLNFNLKENLNSSVNNVTYKNKKHPLYFLCLRTEDPSKVVEGIEENIEPYMLPVSSIFQRLLPH